MIHTIVILLVFILMLAGILLVPFMLPGTWLIAATGLVYSIFYPFDGGETSAWWVNGWLLGLAAFGEVMEFLVGTLGGKAVKVSNGAIISAFLGGIAGAILGSPVFIIGSLIGLFVGVFVGALIYEWVVLKSFRRGFFTACAVLTTRMMASFLKTVLAIGMAFFLGFKIF